uniref:Uncharacterized protein n=1 Tax=viral metagenome TaxID=1070528 RepID=A0A6C0BNJ2_9ZZZZ
MAGDNDDDQGFNTLHLIWIIPVSLLGLILLGLLIKRLSRPKRLPPLNTNQRRQVYYRNLQDMNRQRLRAKA